MAKDKKRHISRYREPQTRRLLNDTIFEKATNIKTKKMILFKKEKPKRWSHESQNLPLILQDKLKSKEIVKDK